MPSALRSAAIAATVLILSSGAGFDAHSQNLPAPAINALADPLLPPATLAQTASGPSSPDSAEPGGSSWREQKCNAYRRVRDQVVDALPDPHGLRPEFLRAEEDYIADGCQGRAYACPQNQAETDYANDMSLRMMADGLSGTFLPYGCPAR